MGGVETKLITLRRPEVFGYWGLLSGGMYMPEEIKDPKCVKYIFEGCGDKENPEGINKSAEAKAKAKAEAEAAAKAKAAEAEVKAEPAPAPAPARNPMTSNDREFDIPDFLKRSRL